MNGSKERIQKKTIRFTEEESIKIERASRNMGISESDYIRQAVYEKLNHTNTNCIKAVCELSTVCTDIIHRYELLEEDEKKLVRGIEYICQQL
ncbi:MAG: hypothetical protein IKJ01_02930 [Lachnospiraceae bacterium]|nr:hypothetical protein [Lachnospiraceae bacterium]